MNEKAASLGMTHTAFLNPSGLDEAGHSSCALAMARLAACAMQDPTFARIVSTRTACVGARTMTDVYKRQVVSTVDDPTDGYDAAVDYDALAGETISVAASPTPHAEILEVAKAILAEKNIDVYKRQPIDCVDG